MNARFFQAKPPPLVHLPAMWEEGTILELSTFKDYGTYMEAKGYDSSWNHLDLMGLEW